MVGSMHCCDCVCVAAVYKHPWGSWAHCGAVASGISEFPQLLIFHPGILCWSVWKSDCRLQSASMKGSAAKVSQVVIGSEEELSHPQQTV